MEGKIGWRERERRKGKMKMARKSEKGRESYVKSTRMKGRKKKWESKKGEWK